MLIAKEYRKNIFCLEGDWTPDLKNTQSIRSALSFMYDNLDIRFIHRHCTKREQFEYYLKKFSLRKYKSYSICYFAFHGKPGSLLLAENEIVTLDDLAAMVGDTLKDRIIHFGSCETLSVDIRHIKKFIRETNALAICGYKTDVDFLPSSIFDMLFFEMCQRYKNMNSIERDMKLYYGKLLKMLGFRVIYNSE